MMTMQTKVILDKQDLTYLSWTKIRNSSGTAGSFLKAYSDLGVEKVYYKLSNYDAYKGIMGHECVNELIVDRLLTILGIEHLSYQLIHTDILIDGQPYATYLCASSDFKNRGESKIALDAYYQAERTDGESPLDFCLRHNWSEYVYQMLVVDFLILNRDRHGANIEVLRNSKAKTLRLAPLFDHGLSLVCSCTDEAAVRAFDVMADRPVQSFVGSRSAYDNLKLIPKDRFPELNPLRESDRSVLFAELETVLPQAWRDKIWEMLWRRWAYYEDFRHQG
jgi:hypothetical protein